MKRLISQVMQRLGRLASLPQKSMRWGYWRSVDNIVKCIESDEFQQLRNAYVQVGFDSTRTEEFVKYFDVSRHVRVNVDRAVAQGLTKCRGKRVLDIGCGFGYFMRVCEHFGHEATGLDYFDEDQESTQVYRKVCAILKCNRRLHLIQPMRSLPEFDRPFDLIVAYQICFDRLGAGLRWGPSEWRYFLANTRRLLRPGGRVYLNFNRPLGSGGGYSEEVRIYFERLGANVNDYNASFGSPGLLPVD